MNAVVGLTGGISTGKSTVSGLLRAAKVPIVDADVIARQVVEPGTPGLKKIVATFGDDILLQDGTLDRKKLGSIIFNDEGKRKQLNKIVHPAVRKSMLWQVLGHWIGGHKYCIMDVPLLIEGGLWQWVGVVAVVYWYARRVFLFGLLLRPLFHQFRRAPAPASHAAGRLLERGSPISTKFATTDSSENQLRRHCH